MQTGLRLADPVRDVRLARELGMKFGYMHLSWENCEPTAGDIGFGPDRCDWDAVVDAAIGAKIKVIGAIFRHQTRRPDDNWTWAGSDGVLPDPRAWERHVREIVYHFQGRIRTWEFWPEPNCLCCNPERHFDSSLYRGELVKASTIIREIDPGAKIILGGLWAYTINSQFLDFLLSGDIEEYIDAANLHFYLMSWSHAECGFENWQPLLDRCVSLIRERLPAGFPIYMTEFGIPSAIGMAGVLHPQLHSETRGEVLGLSEREVTTWFRNFAEWCNLNSIGPVCFWTAQDGSPQEISFPNQAGLLTYGGRHKELCAYVRHENTGEPIHYPPWECQGQQPEYLNGGRGPE